MTRHTMDELLEAMATRYGNKRSLVRFQAVEVVRQTENGKE